MHDWRNFASNLPFSSSPIYPPRKCRNKPSGKGKRQSATARPHPPLSPSVDPSLLPHTCLLRAKPCADLYFAHCRLLHAFILLPPLCGHNFLCSLIASSQGANDDRERESNTPPNPSTRLTYLGAPAGCAGPTAVATCLLHTVGHGVYLASGVVCARPSPPPTKEAVKLVKSEKCLRRTRHLLRPVGGGVYGRGERVRVRCCLGGWTTRSASKAKPSIWEEASRIRSRIRNQPKTKTNNEPSPRRRVHGRGEVQRVHGRWAGAS